ncbi:MAG: hypothetical protein KGZ90_12915 [Algoriphagus sp.]|nr:hypothetical protein [Algoriphagus sp.]MBS4072230.1 hypothetical protein [Algoriphagus sp.]
MATLSGCPAFPPIAIGAGLFLKGNGHFPQICAEKVADLRRFSRSAKIRGEVIYFNI